MRNLAVLTVSAALLLGLSAPADAAKSQRATQNFRAAHGAVLPEPVTAPGVNRYPGYGPILPGQNRNLDPSNWGGG